MDNRQELLALIEQLSETQMSKLLDVALYLKSQDQNRASLPESKAYQSWVSSENDLYDELFADAVAAR